MEKQDIRTLGLRVVDYGGIIKDLYDLDQYYDCREYIEKVFGKDMSDMEFPGHYKLSEKDKEELFSLEDIICYVLEHYVDNEKKLHICQWDEWEEGFRILTITYIKEI